MPEIKEQLNLPTLGGELIARSMPNPLWTSIAEMRQIVYSWEIMLIIDGPDLRYKPAILSLTPSRLAQLTDLAKSILAREEKIRSLGLDGEFVENFDKLINPKIELYSKNDISHVKFWFKNDTGYRFSRTLSITDLSVILEILKTAKPRADNLIEELKRTII